MQTCRGRTLASPRFLPAWTAGFRGGSKHDLLAYKTDED
jgi:hypothetical protein